MIVEKQIKNRTELLTLGKVQKEEGKHDLAEFIVNRGPRVIAEVIKTAWELEAALETLERQRKTRLELLENARERECEEECYGQWRKLAEPWHMLDSI